jgi:hypothetical protein
MLFLNEVNGRFCMAAGERDRKGESPAISLDDGWYGRRRWF